MSHTEGQWYVAEKARWQGDVRFIRTREDNSGAVGLTNDHDAKLIAKSPELLAIVVRLQVALGEFCCDNGISHEDMEESHSELLNASEAADELIKELD